MEYHKHGFRSILFLTIAATFLVGCPLRPPNNPSKTWKVSQQGDIVSVNYGTDENSPQYAAFHLNSCYFRMIPTSDSGWSHSFIVVPVFWSTETPATEVADFGTDDYDWSMIRDIDSDNGLLFVLTEEELYRSPNLGATWELLIADETPDSGSPYSYWSLDCDQSKLYISGTGGVIESNDFGENFNQNFSWNWDLTRHVDFANNYGWITIISFGSLSGLNFRDPDTEQWSHLLGPDAGGVGRLTADPSAVGAFVERYSYSRVPSGYYVWREADEWHTANLGPYRSVIFAQPYGDGDEIRAFTSDSYTLDRGVTWSELPEEMTAFAFDELSGDTFAAGTTGLWFNAGDDVWQRINTSLAGQVEILTVLDGIVFAATKNGKIYSFDPQASKQDVYHQADIGGTYYQYYVSYFGDLEINYDTTIGQAVVFGKITLSPPKDNQLVAKVEIETDLAEYYLLANRPGEAFKPAFISSMRISPTQWDCSAAKVGNATYDVPTEGWMINPPAQDSVFGLIGGTSDWKTRSPDISLNMGSPMQVTGWVTSSSDPNDDNVGFWAATDTILDNWSYTVTVNKH